MKKNKLPVADVVLEDKELAYVTECIKTNWVSSTGDFVGRFEDSFAEICGSKHAVSTTSGTTALHLALLALGIKAGDEVIVPTLTFIATANAVSYTGAKPVFVDSEPYTWNIDVKQIESSITSKTKAIVPVHLYGHPADMDPILELAENYGLAVIEDAAEAHGAEYKGCIVGSIGDIGIFSFYGNKIITTGEGGMVVTDDSNIAEKVRQLRDHGMSSAKRYWHSVLGYNYRLTNIQAALGLAQTERIQSILDSKISIGKLYAAQLEGCRGITLAPSADWAKNVFWLYSIIVENDSKCSRDELINSLDNLGIESRQFFPPIHTQPIYQTRQYLPVATQLAARGICLPSGISLSRGDIIRVTDAIKDLVC